MYSSNISTSRSGFWSCLIGLPLYGTISEELHDDVIASTSIRSDSKQTVSNMSEEKKKTSNGD